tara:strand:- start:232072 stop:233658 length:1587 start_codon:yes stop_codon:yes gene_type:complete
MKYLIYRNHTLEHLFKQLEAEYNGYGDLSISTQNAKSLIWFFIPPPNADLEKLCNEIESYKGQLEMLLQENEQHNFILFTISPRLLGNFVDGDTSVLEKVNEFNSFIYQSSQNTSNRVQFLNIDDFLNDYSLDQIFDWKYYLISQIVIAPTLARPFKKWFNQKLNVLANKRKKCLVLDLDNTLWGGILGEDGISGIQIGDAYPGLAFRTFQELLLEAQKNGVILAVCSKNNLEDVQEVWEKNPYLILKEDHFSAVRANWQNKAENIQSIAQELNIGLDSMVFIDDNPAERQMVKQVLPEVEIPEFPKNPYDLPTFFWEVWDNHFKVFELTNEDKAKTKQYIENKKRSQAKNKFVNVDEYIASLEMTLYPKLVDEFSAVRVAQMTQKTNQFNLTTKRYEVADILEFAQKGHLVYHMAVTDKFGDSGITLLSIAKINGDSAEIDLFLLSCRILGRGIETEFFKGLMNQLVERGVKKVNAQFIPSKKNKQTEEFYERMGMELVNTDSSGIKNYVLGLDKAFELSNLYKVEV